MFLDPPYAAETNRRANIYAIDCLSVAHAVREWAIERGRDPQMRICLCGYEGEHVMPSDWECVAWSSTGGYNENRHKERMWFSPACEADAPLFHGFGE